VSICCPHFRSLATYTPSSLNDATRSTGVSLRVTYGGGSLRTAPASISFILRPFTVIVSVVHSCCHQGNAGSKTVLQENPPVLNCGCWLKQVVLHNGHKMVVAVVVVVVVVVVVETTLCTTETISYVLDKIILP